MVKRGRRGPRVRPHAELPFVPLGAVQVQSPHVAGPWRNVPSQVPEVFHGDGHLQHPASVLVTVIIHRAVQCRLQLHAFALPLEVDILGADLTALESHVVEEGSVCVHLVAEISGDVSGVWRGEDLDGVLLPHGPVLLGNLGVDVGVNAFI